MHTIIAARQIFRGQYYLSLGSHSEGTRVDERKPDSPRGVATRRLVPGAHVLQGVP